MSSLTRRALMSGAGVAAGAVIVGTAGVILKVDEAQAKASTADENPILTKLGNELVAAIAERDKATAHKDACRKMYEATAPAVPDALLMNGSRVTADGLRSVAHIGDNEVDVEGEMVWPDGPKPRRFVASAAGIQQELDYHDGRTVCGRDWRDRLRVAQKYEAAIHRAKEASGIGEALEAHYWAEDTVRSVAAKVSKADACTIDGIMIKARAINALASVTTYGKCNWDAAQLAAAVVAVLGSQAVLS